jgi:hypothetical protein
MEGVTFHETNDCKAEPPHRAVASDGIQGILRTGWLKSAHPTEQGRNHDPVPLNGPHTQVPHVNWTLGEADEYAGGMTPTSVSIPLAAVTEPLASEIQGARAPGSCLDATVSRVLEKHVWLDCA